MLLELCRREIKKNITTYKVGAEVNKYYFEHCQMTVEMDGCVLPSLCKAISHISDCPGNT